MANKGREKVGFSALPTAKQREHGPVSIELVERQRGRDVGRYNLADITDLESRYRYRSAHDDTGEAEMFPFRVVLPHLDGNSDDANHVAQFELVGEIRYFPHDGNQALKPAPFAVAPYDERKYDKEIVIPNEHGNGTGSQGSQGGGGAASSSSSGSAIRDPFLNNLEIVTVGQESTPGLGPRNPTSHAATFDVYWQNRLVPNSGVTKLPFFPTNKLTKPELDELGRNW